MKKLSKKSLGALFVAVGIATYFLWAVIHELSHYLVYRWTAGVRVAKFKLYPHKSPWGFRFAAVYVTLRRMTTDREQFWASFAPRIPDAVGAIAFPFAALADGWLFGVLSILLGGSLIDLWVGSTGISKNHDLRKAARAVDVSPWWFRIGGFTALALSAAGWVVVYFVA